MHRFSALLLIATQAALAWGGISDVRASEKSAVVVENGTLRGAATLDVSEIRWIVVPKDAVIARTAEPGVRLIVERTLSFDGYPPASMLKADWSGCMGAMSKRSGNVLTIWTFGTWNSRIEGGAAVLLDVRIPRGISVLRRAKLPKPSRRSDSMPTEVNTDGSCRSYWYAPKDPPAGFLRVPLIDVETADR